MRFFKFALMSFVVFLAAFAITFMFRDPPVNMTQYESVVPEYKSKIRELMTVTQILRNPYYKLRHGQALKRLEALAEEGKIPEAIDTAYVYHAQPEVFYCPEQSAKGCDKKHESFDAVRTEKALYWARKMEGRKQITALSRILRDPRFAPAVTEEDRIALMFATEDNNRTALNASVALAYHHLDRRYFGNNMMDEALLWLNRARELEQQL